MRPILRAGRDGDGPALVALIAGCWSEHPGCVMDLHGENPHLLAPATYYGSKGGRLVVAEQDGVIVGTVSCLPASDDVLELKALYVAREHRGTGLAALLLDAVEDTARSRGDRRLVLWSDTRFTRAHRFYERHGYVASGAVRALGDLSNSLEYPYAKPMSPLAVARLDAAAASSAVRALAAILVASVDDGASVSFLAPLDPARAEAFWRETARGVAEGREVLIVGWRDGRLAGTVTVTPAWQPNQAHRAAVSKLLVHPDARGAGLGNALMEAAERESLDLGRTLLTLDTAPGGASARLYHRRGYREAGRIPGYSLDRDGRREETVIFWRALDAGSPAILVP